ATLPSTGASSNDVPGGSSEARRSTAAGPTVEDWITVVDESDPASTPSGPSVTSRSAAGSETIVITASARRAASAGEEHAAAPRSVAGLSALAVRFHTTTT